MKRDRQVERRRREKVDSYGGAKEKKNEKYRVESLLEKNFREDGKEQ